MKNLIKEINKISLSKNEFLVIKCPEDTGTDTLNSLRKSLNSFAGGMLKDKVIIFAGDVEFTKVSKIKE